MSLLRKLPALGEASPATLTKQIFSQLQNGGTPLATPKSTAQKTGRRPLGTVDPNATPLGPNRPPSKVTGTHAAHPRIHLRAGDPLPGAFGLT